MKRLTSLLVLGFLFMACGSDDGGGGSGGAGATGGSSGSAGSSGSGGSAGSSGSGGSAGSSGGSGGSAGSSGSAGSGATGGSGGNPNACPHVTLGTSLPIAHSGDTTGLPHIAESTRLEWGDAPDDTLLFTATEAGDYEISMTETSSNDGCGASIQEYADAGTTKYYDTSWCPTLSSVANLDGVYAAGDGITSTFTMAAGQSLMIWVSCTTWSDVQAGPYTLSIKKL